MMGRKGLERKLGWCRRSRKDKSRKVKEDIVRNNIRLEMTGS
jgi:hypothetical protein